MTASDLDDLCPAIGYRATRILAAWFAGRKLHVPVRAQPGHPLEILIGPAAFNALVREFATDMVWIPTLHEEDRFRRDRQIAEWIAQGWSVDRIAGETGISPRRVEQIRIELVDRRWISYAQGFKTAMAHGHGGKRVVEPPALLFSGSTEVCGEPPPPSACRSCGAMSPGSLAAASARQTAAG